jgi:Beta-lactamase enzyme family/ORF 12 gene product N-terminal
MAAHFRSHIGRLGVASLSALTAVWVLGAQAGAVASPSATPQPTFVARSSPKGAVGDQLSWFLGAVADAPLSDQTIESHFDSAFLSHVSAGRLNRVLGQFHLTKGASFVGLLNETDTSLVAIAEFGSEQVKVTISIDATSLISSLLLASAPLHTSSWSSIDGTLSALGPDVGFLAARVSPTGTCQPVHAVASSTPRPLASQFKLFVLGALAKEIEAGRVSWDQSLTVQDSTKSFGNPPGSGSLQYATAGSTVSIEEAATKMISISDNTAADMLIRLVGRTSVEAQVRRWSANASAYEPFLTTRETLLLHYYDFPALANRYLATPSVQRDAFLASSVGPLPISGLQVSPDPRDVEKIEWFASPDDICRAFAGLQSQATVPRLAPLSSILARNSGGIGLDPSEWHTVWFKGGSEPGVVTLGYLATNKQGKTFVVVAMVSDADAPLSPLSPSELLAVEKGAFGLLG